MRRRTYLKTSGTSVAALTLAGCLGGGDDGDGDESIHFLARTDSPEGMDFYSTLVDNYTQETGVPVQIEFGGSGVEMNRRVATLLQAGEQPEVAHVRHADVAQWLRDDIAEPITDVVESVEEDWGDSFPDNTKISFEGEEYFIPSWMAIAQVAYRQDVFEEFGGFPSTWEEQRSVFGQLPDALPEGMGIGNYAFGLDPGGTSQAHSRLLTSNAQLVEHTGDEMFSGWEVVLDQGDNFDRAVAVAEYIEDLRDGNWTIDPNLIAGEIAAVYSQGQTAVGWYPGARPTLQAHMQDYEGVGQQTRIAPIAHPSDGRQVSRMSAFGYAIGSEASGKEEAKDFVEYMMTGERLIEKLARVDPIHNVPPLRSILDDDRYRNADFMQELNIGDQVFEDIGSLIEGGLASTSQWGVPEPQGLNPYLADIYSERVMAAWARDIMMGEYDDAESRTQQLADDIRGIIDEAGGA